MTQAYRDGGTATKGRLIAVAPPCERATLHH